TGGLVLPQYDAAGNMISGPNRDNNTVPVYYTFDAWNRLVEVYNDLVTVQLNEYDGLNRRIKKANDLGWGYRFYYNLDWQMLEAREVSGVGEVYSIDHYIWNPDYVDSPLVCLHDGNADGDVSDNYPTDWRRYYLTDANHNVTTTIRFDRLNSITYDGITRNVYTPYGKVTRLDENWAGIGVEEYFDSPLYAGYFFDFETALYQVRNRYYDSGLSIWLNRDPIESTPNLYAYCGDNPTNRTDPLGLEGHHWVPQKVVDDLRYLMSKDAYDVFKAGTSGRATYNHTLDTWLGVTHLEYSKATESLIRNLAAENKNWITKSNAEKLLTWIAEEKVPAGKFGKANAKYFEVVFKWRKGFLQSLVVAERAAELNPSLTAAELKAIARAAVNKEPGGMSRAAMAVYGKLASGGKLGARALGAAARKVIPGLIVYSFASAATKGYAGENVHGLSGFLGAGDEMFRELMLADLVESIAFPAIESAAGAVENIIVPGGIEAGAKRIQQQRFGDLAP
ncbi:MAG TPA: RHS repeat-associated core domain-containing protein, partial [Thermoguttaceae bacterium]